MTDYLYDLDICFDPDNPNNIVRGGLIEIYDGNDLEGTTLLALKDTSGNPIPNPMTSNEYGVIGRRITTSPQCIWKSGPFSGVFNSYKGLRDEAVAARGAAESAASDASQSAVAAAEAAALALGPTDEQLAEALLLADIPGQVAAAAPAAVTPLVEPLVTEALAADSTVSNAAAAAATAAVAGKKVLEAPEILEADIIFSVADEDGRRTWIEADANGKPTPRSKSLMLEAVGPDLSASITADIGLGTISTAITELGFVVVDEDGRRTELEVGEDGRLTQRVIDSIGSRLIIPPPANTRPAPEPWWSTKVKAWDPALNAYNLHHGNMRKWSTALARARAGLGTAHLGTLGDSRTYGAHATGSSNPKWDKSYPGRERRLLDQKYGFTSGTGMTPYWDAVYLIPAHDSRWAKGSGVTSKTTYGATSGGYGPQGLACAVLDNAAGNGWIEFTPTQQVNRFTLWMVSDPANAAGLATVSVDGVSMGTVALNAAGTGGTLAREAGYAANQIVVEITGLAMGTHTIRVTGAATELTYVVGVEGHTGQGVRVSNMGRSSTNLSHWTFDSGNGRGGMPWHIDALKADLLVVMAITNDRSMSGATYKTEATKIVDRQRAAGGDILFILPAQPDYAALGSGTTEQWAAICSALYQLADEKDFPILDNSFSWGSFAQSNALGLFADSVHENDTGLELIAGALHNMLTIT